MIEIKIVFVSVWEGLVEKGYKRDMRELPRVLEIYCIFISMLVTQMYTVFKTHQSVCLRCVFHCI